MPYFYGLTTAFWYGLLFAWVGLAYAQDTTAVELSFDDIAEEPPPTTSAPAWVEMIHLSGRFDLNLEVDDPMDDGDVRTSRFRNYHKFLFLNVTPNDRVSLDAEVLDLSYYEVKYAFSRGYTLRFGKIWVPFGATPFHHYYGGLQGDPFQGLLVPNVWSEFGVSLGGTLLARSLVQLAADAYVMRGFDGRLGEVLPLANGGADGTYAVGARTRLSFGTKLAAWGSVLYNRFGDDDEGQLLLWGGDLLLDYGLVDLPLLQDLRLRAAFARADIQDEVLVKTRFNPDHWYYRYGDYAELSYRGISHVTPRLRYGTIIDFDDRISNNDSHNWELALLTRLNRHLLLLVQYQFNLEEVNEIDNDLARLQVVFEF